ncbi:MAG: SDR family oxidoreductase [Pseudomonadota bacterium]
MRLTVLVTGAAGYLGAQLVTALLNDARNVGRVIAVDQRPIAAEHPRLLAVVADIRDDALPALVAAERPDVIVHLAAIVTPARDSSREFEYSVDVLGSRNVLSAAVAGGVRRLIVSSSGAAYGYHADHPAWIDESAPLRGNEEFSYSRHKRLVEELLADARERHPELEQTVFRVSTILGRRTRNQITALFDKPRLVSVAGGDDRFVLIWDEDAVRCFHKAVVGEATGIYNLCGDGAITMKEMAGLMQKPHLELPAWLIRRALWLGQRLGISRYGPEQVNFLRYRPVLSNAALKRDFGFIPRKTSREVFEFYLDNRHGDA